MLELTRMRTTREDTPDSPVEIHCLDIHGSHYLFSERNGILFFEGEVDTDICITEEASGYSAYVQNLSVQAGIRADRQG